MGLKSKFNKCVNIPQIKALLWKDVLIKKRQPVSIIVILVLFNVFYRVINRVSTFICSG